MIDFNKRTRHHAGRARIIANTILLEFMNDPKIEIPISDIKLIGEYTTENGPHLDDYFIVFYYSENSYAEISMYAENLIEMIDELETKIGGKLKSHLTSSAVWNSNILWPNASKGETLWLTKRAKPENFNERMHLFFGGEKLEIELTEIAKSYL